MSRPPDRLETMASFSSLLSCTPRRQYDAQQQQQQQWRSHYSYTGPGSYNPHQQHEQLQHQWSHRDFDHRGFTIGIGGPVGSGKTALVKELCTRLQQQQQQPGDSLLLPLLQDTELGVVTNDIFTQEDAEFLMRSGVLDASHIRAVETGGCPHAAIREDVSANLSALEELTAYLSTATAKTSSSSSSDQKKEKKKKNVLLLCESGGDNLAAHFSHELADLTIYVIDVAGGDKVPRKGGPGITQADLLLINKIDLAEAVGADLNVMRQDAAKMRGLSDSLDVGLTVFGSVKQGTGMEQVVDFILRNYHHAMALRASSEKNDGHVLA